MTDTIDPIAKAEILIRKPISDVFNAFRDPEIITKFWFDESSGPLMENASVKWHWHQFNMSIPVSVKSFKENDKIVMTWGDGADQSTLEWSFTERSEQETYVSLINKNFQGNLERKISEAIDSTGGFNLVIAAAKAYLEHGIRLNIVADRF